MKKKGYTLYGVDGPPKRLLKNDASPQECDERVREKDAGSANSSAICATENAVSCRRVRSGGQGFVFQQPRRKAKNGLLEPGW